MSQVLLLNEQQESFRNAYLKKRKKQFLQISKKKKKKKRHKDTIVKWAKGRDYTERSLKAYTGGKESMS